MKCSHVVKDIRYHTKDISLINVWSIVSITKYIWHFFYLSAGASDSVYFCVQFAIYYTDINFSVLNMKSMYMVHSA